MFAKISLRSSLLALPLLAIGCGDMEPVDFDAEDASVESTQAALCSDPGAANVSGMLTLGDVGGSVYGTSPNASYGSTLCAGRYVVEATATQGKPNLNASATFADLYPASCSA